MTVTKPKILLGHTFWGRGGAEVAAMWYLQALAEDYQVDLVTRGGWDLADLNRISGTHLKPGAIGAVKLAPCSNISVGGALWVGVYKRYLRRLARDYDLCFTASRAEDWGVAAVHVLSDVTWNTPLKMRFGSPDALVGASLLRRAYFQIGQWLAGSSGRDPTQHDRFVANSQWTANISSEFCTHPPVVIYPAIPGDVQFAPWSKREDSFLCLGRISPEKRIERVIAILDQVRILGRPIRLHLVGSSDDPAYLRQVQRLCDDRREWVVVHGALYGDDKKELLASCRYGINACDREAFGIATAEMTKAGIVPFVPQAGAQAEIVQEDALIYGDIEDAALKIDALLRSEARQLELHAAMLRRGDEFNPDKFCNNVRALVKGELERLAIAKL